MVVLKALRADRPSEIKPRQRGVIYCAQLPPPRYFFLRARQKRQTQGGMEFAHLAIDAQAVMRVVDMAESASKRQGVMSIRVPRNDAAAFCGMENLCGVETTNTEITVVQKAFAPIA